ncbi:MAG: histidine phosphatase family protein [Ginsengibacter sp.]
MKTLLIVRHAKSGWDDDSLSDFERTLTDRGKSDAIMMARRLIEKSIGIEAFVSSSARRAQQTAKIFMNEYATTEKSPLLIPSLYEGSVKDFNTAINSFNDESDVVALFAHNPGVTDFVNSTECSPIYNMPTCAVFGMAIETSHWKEFRKAKKEFLFFDYPKNIPTINE